MDNVDVLRYIAIGQFCFIAGWAVVIMIEASRFRTPASHIYFVVLSYVVLAVGWAFELSARLHEPFGWRLGVALAAGALGIVSLVSMHQHYRIIRRIARHTTKSQEAALKLLEELPPEVRIHIIKQGGLK